MARKAATFWLKIYIQAFIEALNQSISERIVFLYSLPEWVL